MSQLKNKPLSSPYLWPSWLAIGFLWLIGQLPWNWLLALGRGVGHLAWYLAASRRNVVLVNMRLCFPELSEKEQRALAKASVVSAIEALFETTGTYFNRRIDLNKRLTVVGREHVDDAIASGQGLILLGMHFNTIDVTSRLLGGILDFNVVYRPNDNPVMDWLITWGRGQNVHNIDRQDMRQMVRCLKKGEVVWYAPDQDYGRDLAVYVPFMGQTAATITTTSRIARMGNAKVVPCAHYRLPNGQYRIEFGAPLQNFPTKDDEADAILINQTVEHYVRKHPEQYLWLHKRFKHQPDGAKLYQQAK